MNSASLSSEQWSRLRFALGMAQMFGAVFSLTLVLELGITALSLTSVIGTGLLTGLSRFLFKRKGSTLRLN
jgi:hypothetical protein